MVKRKARAVVPKAYLEELATEEEVFQSKLLRESLGKEKKGSSWELTYEVKDVEVSFLPQASDLELEDRYMIAIDMKSKFNDLFHLEERHQSTDLVTKPKLKEEEHLSSLRVFLMPRSQDDIMREKQFLLKNRTLLEKLRKVPVEEPSRFECVKLIDGETPYRKIYLARDRSRFSFPSGLQLASWLEHLKIQPATLEMIERTRLSPILQKHSPHPRSFLLAACVALLFDVLCVLVAILGFGFDVQLLSQGNLLQIAVALGTTILCVLFPCCVFRIHKRLSRKAWRKVLNLLDAEINAVNQQLRDLEGGDDASGRGGVVSFQLVQSFPGDNPFQQEDSIEDLLRECEEERKILRKVKKEGESNLADKGRSLVKLLRKVIKQRMVKEKKRETAHARGRIVHHIILKVPLHVTKKKTAFAEVLQTGKAGATSVSLSSLSPAFVDVCTRCRVITRFARKMGLESVATQLCKSAFDDEVEYHKYIQKKLAGPNDKDSEAGRVGGLEQDEQEEEVKEEEEEEKRTGENVEEEGAGPRCRVCSQPLHEL